MQEEVGQYTQKQLTKKLEDKQAELIRMQAKSLRQFYMRPRQVKKQFLELRTLSPKMLLYGLYGMAL